MGGKPAALVRAARFGEGPVEAGVEEEEEAEAAPLPDAFTMLTRAA